MSFGHPDDKIHRLILLFLRADRENTGALGRAWLKELSLMPVAIAGALKALLAKDKGVVSLSLQRWLDLCCSAAVDDAAMSEFVDAADGMEARSDMIALAFCLHSNRITPSHNGV